MTPTDNASSIGRRFFEEMLGKANWNVAEEILTPDIVMHHPSSPTPVMGREAVVQFLSAFRSGFPDLQMLVEDVFSANDKTAIRWHVRGTHTASLFGIAPTGKAIDITGISIVRLVDGKIAEDWVSEDSLGMMRQIGLVKI